MTRLAAAAAAALLLPGCYYLQAAAGQAEVLSRRQPIERVIARPATPPALRSRLALAREARRFAVEALALPDNGSYQSYAALGRPYVAWNVFAAPEFSVEPRRWCFPIAGCVAYRGYFKEAAARRVAGRLAGRGYDTWVGPVPAYSTLGHFDDPLLDTMLRYDDLDLVAILFHELAHQVYYRPGDSDFNEAFATAVEYEGLRRWLERRGETALLAQFRERRERRAAATALLLGTRAELQRLYAAGGAPEALRAAKAAAFETLRARYATLRASWGGLAAYDGPFGADLNNARLVALATYERCVPAFEAELARVGGDLPAFYAAVRQLPRSFCSFP